MERMGRATHLRQGLRRAKHRTRRDPGNRAGVDGNAATVAGASTGNASDQRKSWAEAMSEWSHGDASDIDGKTETSQWAGAHESTWVTSEFPKQATGMSRHGRRVGITTWEECSRAEVVGASKTWRILCWRQVVAVRLLMIFGQEP
jgi:hypothetical protein